MYRLVENNKTRAMRREEAMARRSTYQKGNVDRHNGHWTVRYMELNHRTGKWTQKRARLVGCDDSNGKKTARKYADVFMAEINNRNNTPPDARELVTFANFIKGPWVSYQAKQTLQPSSEASYKSMIKKHFLPALGDKLINEITPADMTELFDGFRARVSSKYASNLYALLNEMFEVAYEYDVIQSKPLRRKLHKPKFEVAEKPTLSIETLKAVRDELEGGHKLLVIVFSVFGGRLGEVLALRWRDVDLVTRTLSISHSLWRRELKRPKTKASDRMLQIPDYVVDLLSGYRSESAFSGPDDFIFCNSEGRPHDPDNLRKRVLYPAMDKVGVIREARKHGFHIFRHTAGTMLHDLTRDMKLVQTTLGHSRMSTTADIYVHTDRTVAGPGAQVLAGAMLANYDLTVTQEGAAAA